LQESLSKIQDLRLQSEASPAEQSDSLLDQNLAGISSVVHNHKTPRKSKARLTLTVVSLLSAGAITSVYYNEVIDFFSSDTRLELIDNNFLTMQRAITYFNNNDLFNLTKSSDTFLYYAKKDNTLAQYYLAQCYFKGIGLSKDKIKALFWLKTSADAGNKDAKRALNQIAEKDKDRRKDIMEARRKEDLAKGTVDEHILQQEEFKKKKLAKLKSRKQEQLKKILLIKVKNREENIRKAQEYFKHGDKHFHKTGDVDKAIQSYTKGIQLDSSYINAYFNLGLIYQIEREHSKAIKNFSKVIALDSKNAKAYLYRGQALNYIEENKTNACIDWKKSCDLGYDTGCNYITEQQCK